VKRGESISFDEGVTLWRVMLVRAGGDLLPLSDDSRLQ
jgi:hypothetical protein